MQIIRIPRIMQDEVKTQRMHGKSIGFVPTMGALHEGHKSLLRTSRLENDIVVSSIFVNPLQFGPKEDFQRYPRDIEKDTKLLREAEVDILFLPDASSMYPDGFSVSIDVEGLSEKLCGQFRQGHFKGVATVVTKLFNIVYPTRAYLGQKDYQQYLIIKRLVNDLNMEVDVVICPTQRAEDGLAMSSRNQYLKPEERKSAGIIYRALKSASEKIKSGTMDVAKIKGLMWDILKPEPLIAEVQYAGVYDVESLDELTEIKDNALLAVAVKFGDVRLIDNMLVVCNKPSQ
ncbi:MAG: pantoate--beta-alanine ligase [Nitrospirae bacterium]|nr:pantoate--beta-alanine ligase [Nitrospirota bacterium]